jgi:nucleotide-binding universal stress UspA family protein
MGVNPDASARSLYAAGEDRLAADNVSLRRILVPLDGSRLAECVAGVAVSLAARFRARVILLHVLERGAPSTVHGDRHLNRVEDAERYLYDVQSRWGGHGGIELESHVHRNPQGDVPGSIIDHAVDQAADLILLSTHGAGGPRRALFGSVAQQVLRKGAHPVLLVRPPGMPGAMPFAPRRVFMPLDGSTSSEAALPLAGTLARAYGADLCVFRMVPTLSSVSGERATTALLAPAATVASLELEEAQAKDEVTRLVAQLRERGLHVVGAVGRGEPAQGIVDEVQRLAPDIIVMATHARTGLDAIFSGSVAAEVAGKVTQPILLVRIDNGEPLR